MRSNSAARNTVPPGCGDCTRGASGLAPQAILVEHPAAALEHERHLGEGTLRNLAGPLEVLVHGPRHERVPARVQQAPRGEVQPGNHAGDEHDPVGIDPPPIELFEARHDRIAQRCRRRGVAQHAVSGSPGQCLQHRRGRAKVAVGDPERDHVAAGVAIPADAPGAGALDRRVEIELHAAL
jgi:hypothetical protein